MKREKSTILFALDIVLSGSQSKIDTIGLENLFNVCVIKNFIEKEKSYDKLPQLDVEIYLKDTGNSDLNGDVYSKGGNMPRDGLVFESKSILYQY